MFSGGDGRRIRNSLFANSTRPATISRGFLFARDHRSGIAGLEPRVVFTTVTPANVKHRQKLPRRHRMGPVADAGRARSQDRQGADDAAAHPFRDDDHGIMAASDHVVAARGGSQRDIAIGRRRTMTLCMSASAFRQVARTGGDMQTRPTGARAR